MLELKEVISSTYPNTQ